MSHTLLIGIASLLLTVAAIAKAAVDVLTHQEGNNFFEQFGSWWDARTSWKNKYKDYDKGDLSPRFRGSTTVLVALTDFWHFADFIYLSAYLAAGLVFGIALHDFAWWRIMLFALAIKGAFSVVFEFWYRKFRLKK